MTTETINEEISRLLETPEIFKLWLKSAPIKIVGLSCDSGLCPVNVYLHFASHRVTTYDDVRVGSENVWLIDHENEDNTIFVPLPKWAKKFIFTIDNKNYIKEELTAEECLKVLEKVEEDVSI